MKKFTLLFITAFLSISASAQLQDAVERFQFDPSVSYNNSIPSPTEYLGYELGTQYTFHHQVMSYFEKLAELSDKITFHEYARTYENRSVNYAIITSADNHTNLDEIRAQNLKVANTPNSVSVNEEPVVVWMSYNVHGNEPSSSEAKEWNYYN